MKFTSKALTRAELPGRPNGDAFFVEENKDMLIAGVFDGATVLKDTPQIKKLTQSRAHYASHVVSKIIQEELRKNTKLTDALIIANDALRELAIEYKLNLEDGMELFTTTATVIVIDKKTQKLSFVHAGDSLLFTTNMNGKVKLHITKSVKKQDLELKKVLDRKANEENLTPEEAKKDLEVLEINARSQQESNDPDNPNSFGVLNGQDNKKLAHFIETGEEDLKNITHIFLLSDGAIPYDLDITKQSDQQKLIESIQSKKLYGHYRAQRSQENKDPLHKKFPRYKKHDDFTVVWIKVLC